MHRHKVEVENLTIRRISSAAEQRFYTAKVAGSIPAFSIALNRRYHDYGTCSFDSCNFGDL